MSSQRRWVALILLVNLALSVAYGLVNPLFEAPDEHLHYFTAQWIADNGRLPAVPQPATARPFVPAVPSDWLGQEAAQPPLYYLLASALIASFDTAEARELTIHNPFARLGNGAARGNLNAFVHVHEGWPWREHVWAAHLLRLLSALFGASTLWFIYLSGRVLWPDRPQRALWGMGLAAFLPQLTFQFSAISNDTLITLLASATLYQLLKLTHPPHPASRWRWAWLGLTIGLAILTKSQGVLLLLFALGFIILKRAAPLRPALAWTILPACVLALPLWVRNWQLYGDVTAANQFVIIAGGDRGYSLWQSLAEWRAIWFSLFANFGWFNVVPPTWVYGVWWGLVGAAVWGAIRREKREERREIGNYLRVLWTNFPTSLLLAGWVGLVLAALVGFNMRTPAAQGRLLFPALLPLALGMGYGLARIEERRKKKGISSRLQSLFKGVRWPVLGLVLALGTNLYCLWGVIRPVYALPAIITAEAIPASATRLDAPLGAGLTLVAAKIGTPHAQPEQYIDLTLYWRREPSVSAAMRPELVVELFGRERFPLGKWQGWHGRGLFPADFWPSGGEIVVEETAVSVADDPAAFPTLAQVNIKLAGQDSDQDIGVVEIEPRVYAPLREEHLAQLGSAIQLAAVVADDTAIAGEVASVKLLWQVTAAVEQEYTVFVHLGEQGQPPLAQGDSAPLAGAYPTSRWRAGQTLWDEHEIQIPPALPAGTYPLFVGLYAPTPPYPRLPLLVDGLPQPFDALLIGHLIVTQP